MKFKNILTILVITFLSIYLISCNKDDSAPKVNIPQWMYEVMEEVYYWNQFIPTYESVKSETNPKAFFDKLIYKQEDVWSWLTDDFAGLTAEFEGTPTSNGMFALPGLFADAHQVFFVVAYVYPGSPAWLAGIKRGDIIVKIDGQEINIDNYSTLYYEQNDFSITLGEYSEGTILATQKNISVTSAIINTNPVVFDTILQYNDKKIGYFVYTEFISGKDSSLLYNFGSLMDDFKSQGVPISLLTCGTTRVAKLVQRIIWHHVSHPPA